jgi:hypothetical protein
MEYIIALAAVGTVFWLVSLIARWLDTFDRFKGLAKRNTEREE